MLPIPIFWNQYTATIRGSLAKIVACEGCAAEYVYVLEREGTGVGTSMYMLDNEGAAEHACRAAEDTLRAVLENDFDPVPCPTCGHYQKYMVARLAESQGTRIEALILVVAVLATLDALMGLYRSLGYLQHPSDDALARMATAWSMLPLLCLAGLGLWLWKRTRIRHFDPNRKDQPARIAHGRSRAVTRAEFEKRSSGE